MPETRTALSTDDRKGREETNVESSLAESYILNI